MCSAGRTPRALRPTPHLCISSPAALQPSVTNGSCILVPCNSAPQLEKVQRPRARTASGTSIRNMIQNAFSILEIINAPRAAVSLFRACATPLSEVFLLFLYRIGSAIGTTFALLYFYTSGRLYQRVILDKSSSNKAERVASICVCQRYDIVN